jgi:hypothetical protein
LAAQLAAATSQRKIQNAHAFLRLSREFKYVDEADLNIFAQNSWRSPGLLRYLTAIHPSLHQADKAGRAYLKAGCQKRPKGQSAGSKLLRLHPGRCDAASKRLYK